MAAWFGHLIRTTDGNNVDGVLDAKAGLYLTYPLSPTEFIATVSRRQFALALRFDAEQRVQTFTYQGPKSGEVRLLPDAKVGRDAAAVFPPHKSERWLGFVPESMVDPYFVENNVARWTLRIRLTGARSERQLVAALIRFNTANATFSESFLSGSWALPGRSPRSTRRRSAGSRSRRAAPP